MDFVLPSDPNALLTRDELQRYFKLRARTFRSLLADGAILEPTILLGTSPRWRVRELSRWVSRGGHAAMQARLKAAAESKSGKARQ